MFKPLLISLLLLALAGSAAGADPITEAMQRANAPYRVALFKTNGKSQAEAAQAVAEARQGWSRVAADYGTAPSVPYAGDDRFSRTLSDVERVYARASEQVAANQLAAAHDTLEEVRDLVADLRRRNQVVTFSDHMNAYHAQMERLLDDGPSLLAGAEGQTDFAWQAGALDYLASRLKAEAPVEYLKNDEFLALLANVEKSMADLKAALRAHDAAAMKDALGKVKAPYSKLFVKFG